MKRFLKGAACALFFAGSYPALAADPDACLKPVLADGGWTDNIVQNGFSSIVLKGLGYEPQETSLSLGVLLEGMKMGSVDVFLANWTPNSDSTLNPYIEAGAIRNVGTNLTGAKYALAVPTYSYEAGLKDFADIEKFRAELDGKLHALEAGNDSNNVLIKMQEDKAFGFDTFEIVESSEQGMLAAVEKAVSRKAPIVFVGWSPHPMNTRFEMSYLSGGDAYFGPYYGSAEVWTGLRPAYADQCPNALKFFQNLRFTPEMLSANMQKVLEEDKSGQQVALESLKSDDSMLAAWLEGVTATDGRDGVAAVKAYIEAN